MHLIDDNDQGPMSKEISSTNCRELVIPWTLGFGHWSFEAWLPNMDLNHDKQIQSLLCYRYTIRQ